MIKQTQKKVLRMKPSIVENVPTPCGSILKLSKPSQLPGGDGDGGRISSRHQPLPHQGQGLHILFGQHLTPTGSTQALRNRAAPLVLFQCAKQRYVEPGFSRWE